MRMPPVREASTKPSAATVLPAPVACSNQKRLLAPGSSGLSATSASTPSSFQSSGSSGSSSSSSSSPGMPTAASSPVSGPTAPLPLPFPLPLRTASALSAVSVPASASTWWAESSVPSARWGRRGGARGGGALLCEGGARGAEQQRVLAPPLGRGKLLAALELGQGSV